MSEPVRQAEANLKHERRVAEETDRTRPRFEQFAGQTALKLNLGCGPDVRPGWINVDINLHNNAPIDDAFFNYDLRQGIPLPSGSCSLIYSSHFLEHLPNSYARHLFGECFRVLAIGNRLRLALPNYRAFFQAYLNNDRSSWSLVPMAEIFPTLDPKTMPYGDMMDWGLFQNGEHVAFYDEERTIRVLHEAGFSRASVSEYDGAVDLPDEVRRQSSFYIEAVK